MSESEKKVNLSDFPVQTTRRRFLKGAGAAALGAFLSACGFSGQEKQPTYQAPISPSLSYKPPTAPSATALRGPTGLTNPDIFLKKTETPSPPLSKEALKDKFEINLGQEETVEIPGVQWVPDGHTSMLKLPDGSVRVWFSGGPYTFMVEGKSLAEVNFSQPKFVFGPIKEQTPDGYEGYASIHSVIPGVNQGELIGFFHRELWPGQGVYFPFTAGIGLAISKDNGLTWERQKMIMKGNNPKLPPEGGASGTGQPSAIVIENQVYLFFTDWTRSPDAIHLARARIDSVARPQAWQRWTGEKWGRFGSEKESQAVIEPSREEPNALYAALPGISYNRFLKKYLIIFESNQGFWVAASKDLTNWGQPKLILEFPQPQFPIKSGNTWLSYPTLLSETASDRETDKTGWLVYSQGIRNGIAHSLYRRPFEIS